MSAERAARDEPDSTASTGGAVGTDGTAGTDSTAGADLTERTVATLRAAGCVFAEDEARLLLDAAAEGAPLDALVRRRVAGEPLELVLGWAELGGVRVTVAPGVFVPRQRTRLLVDEAAALADAGSVVVDLCCGTGAVGLAVAAAVPGVELHASDVDPAAVACSRGNLGARGSVYEGDLFSALPADLRGRVDVLVVNAPYVPTAAVALMPPEARLHENLVALDGGADGLEVQRRVARDVAGWLSEGGHVVVETSERQAPSTVEMLTLAGLDARMVRSEETDATVVVAGPR